MQKKSPTCGMLGKSVKIVLELDFDRLVEMDTTCDIGVKEDL